MWEVLSDPNAVVECVDGASLGAIDEDGWHHAGLAVKFGPARVTFRARFVLELDSASRSGTVRSRGKDTQGGTRIHADMSFRIIEGDEAAGSAVLIEASTEVTGRLSSVVEAGAAYVVERMTADFTRRLAERLAGASGKQGESTT